MIIGVNGRIGSGKDTVGSIIQYLTSDYYPHKSYDRFLEKKSSDWNPPFSDWEIKRFAGKLKQIASMLTGIPIEKFEDQEFKKTFLGPEWDELSNWKVNHFDETELRQFMSELGDSYYLDGSQVIEKMTVRKFLQRLGTDAIRDGLHVNTWVNALMADYKPVLTEEKEHWNGHALNIGTVKAEYPNWIITDTRFPNEAEAIKKKDGIIIRVVRKGQNSDVHVSETALDSWEFDHVIYNDGTIDDLIKKVQICLQQEQLL